MQLDALRLQPVADVVSGSVLDPDLHKFSNSSKVPYYSGFERESGSVLTSKVRAT